MNIDETKINQLMEKLIGDLSAGYGGVMVSIGDKLGLYKVMAGAGPLSATEVAHRAGCAPRYTQEWLNSQVAGGYIDYHPEGNAYELNPEQTSALADDTSPNFIPHAWNVVASMWADEDQATQAIATGKGINWGDHHERLYCGVAAFFRNAYQANLIEHWLPALEGVVEKLQRGGRIADIGCGHGHSTILMAQAFPQTRCYGFDSHPDSIAAARELAQQAGVADRVEFTVTTGTRYPNHQYDLICFFDCLHDMGFPVEVAAHARQTLAPDGTVMLVEPFAGERVEHNINPIGRLYYSASTTLCCAHAISENGTHVLGGQAGETQLAQVLQEAGFNHFRRAVETPFNLILEARQ